MRAHACAKFDFWAWAYNSPRENEHILGVFLPDKALAGGYR